MNNIILLILCFIAGMLLHRFKRMSDTMAPLANLMVAVGIAISFATLPCWW